MERVKSAYGILRSNAPPTVTVWIHCRPPFSTSYQNRFAISPAQEASAFTESTAGKSKAPLLPRWRPKSFWFVEIRLYNAAGIYSAVFVTERSISAGVSAVMEVPLIFQMKHSPYQGSGKYLCPLSRIKQKQEVSQPHS